MSASIKSAIVIIGAGLIALALSLLTVSNVLADGSGSQDAGSASAAVSAGSGSAAASPPSSALPDPVESPSESAGLLYRMYKAGQLVPLAIVAAFWLLTLLQRWVAWFKVGWRKLAITAGIAGLATLAERAASGTTPNLMMIMGAIGVVLSAVMNFKGEEKPVKV